MLAAVGASSTEFKIQRCPSGTLYDSVGDSCVFGLVEVHPNTVNATLKVGGSLDVLFSVESVSVSVVSLSSSSPILGLSSKEVDLSSGSGRFTLSIPGHLKSGNYSYAINLSSGGVYIGTVPVAVEVLSVSDWDNVVGVAFGLPVSSIDLFLSQEITVFNNSYSVSYMVCGILFIIALLLWCTEHKSQALVALILMFCILSRSI